MKKQYKKQAKQRVFPRTLSLTLFSDSFFCDCQLCVATLSLSPQCNDDTLSLHSAMTMTIVDTTMFRCFLCSNESSSFVDLMTCVVCTLVQARETCQNLPSGASMCWSENDPLSIGLLEWPLHIWTIESDVKLVLLLNQYLSGKSASIPCDNLILSIVLMNRTDCGLSQKNDQMTLSGFQRKALFPNPVLRVPSWKRPRKSWSC